MKQLRFVAGIMCLLLLSGMLVGCGTKQELAAVPAENDNFHIYATFYPLYALTEGIVGDVPDVELSCLVQPQDGCIRSYQLSDWDLTLLASAADAVIAGGKGLESFESVLYALGEDGPGVSAVLYDMDLTVGSEPGTDDESHWKGENPHIYMKTDGALEIAERICTALGIFDARNKDTYEQNLGQLLDELAAIQRELQLLSGELAGERVIVMNEALVYAAEECGLEIAACIERESGEAFYDSTLEACIAQLDESGAKVILIEQQAPKAFCAALEGAGYVLARLDVLSTHPAADGTEGYLTALKENAAEISAAFEAAGEVVQ